MARVETVFMRFRCPHCKKRVKDFPRYSGRPARCPHCHGLCRTPTWFLWHPPEKRARRFWRAFWRDVCVGLVVGTMLIYLALWMEYKSGWFQPPPVTESKREN